jgi:starch-binding outer membrane protein, SusD/RagB family
MAWHNLRARLANTVAVVGATLLPFAACSPGDILDVTDPDIIEEVTSAAGALALRNGVLHRLTQATTGIQNADAVYLMGGLLADEWRSGDTFVQRNNMDQRIFEPTNTFHENRFRDLNRVRVEGERAIEALRQYAPDSVSAVGLIFAVSALAEVVIAEHYCNGTPLSNISDDNKEIYGPPQTNDAVFQLAIQHADSAIAHAGGSALVTNLAKVVKARALLDRGQFDAAAAAVDGVPLAFRFEVSHSLNATQNQNWSLNVNARRYTMGDREGGNGLDYVSSNDPRLPRRIAGGNVFDTAYPITLMRIGIWDRTTPVVNASGIEAELIRAEADLRRGDNVSWLTRINALRVNTSLYPPIPSALGTAYTRGPALTALADPGTPEARVNTHFRERAFWMYGTGHRLGDMRRLIRQYSRTAENVFPTGPFFKGGNYGDAIQIPIPFEEKNNPEFTECLDRNA